MTPQSQHRPVSIFIAYSRKDKSFQESLCKHLRPLERNQKIQVWSDSNIEPGQTWDAEIKDALLQADIIIMLVSADSIDSEYFHEEEARISLERHYRGEARVVPLILRPCDWEETPLGNIQALPKNGKPIVAWEIQDDGWNDAVSSIKQMVGKARLMQFQKNDTEPQVMPARSVHFVELPHESAIQTSPPKIPGRQALIRKRFSSPQVLSASMVIVFLAFLFFVMFTNSGNFTEAFPNDNSYKSKSEKNNSTDRTTVSRPTQRAKINPDGEQSEPSNSEKKGTSLYPSDKFTPKGTVEDAQQTESKRIAKEKARQLEEARRNKIKSDAASAFGKKKSNVKTGIFRSSDFSNRKVISQPKMVNDQKETGKVGIEVCIDGSGRVISAEFTLLGSSTYDTDLQTKAIAWAKQFKFTASNNLKECGTIIFNFQHN